MAEPAHAGPRWPRRVERARDYAVSRSGEVSIALVDDVRPGKVRGYRVADPAPCASVIKVMFMTAYLRTARDRRLNDHDRSLLAPMIRRSDNVAATRIADTLGAPALYDLAHAVGMKNFVYTRPWGLSTITGRDQARFMLSLERYIPERHEGYARYLLSHVVESQRWGIGRVRLHGWKVFFKGGWGSGTGWADHQVAALEREGRRIGVAVLVENSPSHDYGKETLRGIFARLLEGL